MLEWTGERFVPWARAPAVAYEHLHRYRWVSEIAGGLRVLDLASGEGYGSAILAGFAASVTGVEIDEAAVRHASIKYLRPNLSFIRGSISEVPAPDRAFDVIVCFEAIEHVEQQEKLICEVKRLLSEDGLFIVSTPNKDLYKGDDGQHNPFHVKELSYPDLNALLTRHFSHVRYFGQRVVPASSLWPLATGADAPVREFVIRKAQVEFETIAAAQRSAEYFLAVASARPICEYSGSVLLDDSNELGRVWAETSAWQDEKLRETAEQVEALARQVDELDRNRELYRKQLDQAQERLRAATQELDAIHASRGWKAVLKMRKLLGYLR